MASTYSTSLKLELIGNGDQSGTWGTTTNNNLGVLIEQAIAGVQTITMSNANYTLTDFNGVSDEARNMVIVATGTNSATRQVIAPLVPKFYVVFNNTTGGYNITFGGSTGSTVTIANGITVQVYCDGTNFYSAQSGSPSNWRVEGNSGLIGNLSVGGTTSLVGNLTAINADFNGTATAITPTVGDNSTKIATTSFVQSALSNGLLPTGSIVMWSTGTAPTGYLLCNGAAVSRTTYSALFGVIGVAFGAGDTTTTFNLPNYTNRMPYGTTVAATGGSADAVVVSHTHTATSVVTDPGHVHPANSQSVQPNITGGSGNISSASGNTGSAATGITVATTNSTTGVSGTNANLPPYLGISFIIKT